MGDNWLTTWFSFHSNHIDLPVVEFMCGGIVLGGSQHVPLLSWRNGDLRWPVALGGARLDFNEAGEAIFLGDDVDFPIRRAHVARDHVIAILAQIVCGDILAPLTEFLVVLIHPQKRSRMPSRRSSHSYFG
jgi:hypothetical protein